MIELKINGKTIQTEAGTTILQAALFFNIHIPHLCYHPAIQATGSCRLCVVEVEGARNLVASCCTPVSAGMVVWTESPPVVAARKTILELLLSNHPHDCLSCDKNGDCLLQKYAYRYGVDRNRYQGETGSYPVDDGNPFFIRDLSKCILCGRCKQVCSLQVGPHVYSFGQRGFKLKLIAGLDKNLQDSTCIFCGNCVSLCPTGALQPKLGRGKGYKADLRHVKTICPYCGVGCSLYLQVNEEEKVVGAVPAGGPADAGLLCAKGRFGWDFIQHRERLTRPLIRKGGELTEATWEEALDYVARRLSAVKEEYGPAAIAGMSSAKCSNEENYLLQKFMRACIGTNNVDNSARLCHASTITGLSEAFGSGAATNSLEEMLSTDAFLIIGSNTTETHPVIAFKIHQAQGKGAKVIVADPRRTEIAKRADIHLQHLPGTDGALLNGLLHVIIEEELTDIAYIRERTEGFAQLREQIKKYTPQYVEGITGVPKGDLVKAARMYAASGRAMILYAMGITQHTNGTDNVLAIANLALATGNVGRPKAGVFPLRGQNNVQGACDMGALPGYLPGYQKIDHEQAREKFQEAWGVSLPRDPGLTVMGMLEAAREGKVKALYIMGENPMMSNPDLAKVEESLKELDFLVVQDIFLTETAQLADVVLPGATFAEKEGTYTNTERRVQLGYRAIAPQGDSLADWEIIVRLSNRLGYAMDYPTPAAIMAEIAELTPIYGGINYQRLKEEKGLQWPCPHPEHPGTPSLHQGTFTRGLAKFSPVEYQPCHELPDEEYPYLFVTGRNYYHYHTGTMTRRSAGLEKAKPFAYVEMNPALAGRVGIEDGEKVRFSSRRGMIETRVCLTGRVPDGIIFAPFHYREAAANLLTNPALDLRSQIPGLKVCAARLDRIDNL